MRRKMKAFEGGNAAPTHYCMLLSVQVQALVTMARIFDVFRDVALLQMLCHLLLGDTQGMSLALPIDDAFISQPRLPGVRTVLHLLASCRQLMMPHQNVMLQWKSDLDSDHGLFVNGEWSSPDRNSD